MTEITEVDWRWRFVDAGCSSCGAKPGGRAGLHHHGLSVWCLRCDWGYNWGDLEERYKSDPSRR